MKKDCYVYPAIFDYANDGISIYFPDLVGCNSCADNDEEAFFMAREAMGGWLSIAEEDNEDIPNPSKLIDVSLEPNQRAVLEHVNI